MYTCVAYARHLAFILHIRWVAFMTTHGPACPDPGAWNIVNFLLLTRMAQRKHSGLVEDHPNLLPLSSFRDFFPVREYLPKLYLVNLL